MAVPELWTLGISTRSHELDTRNKRALVEEVRIRFGGVYGFFEHRDGHLD